MNNQQSYPQGPSSPHPGQQPGGYPPYQGQPGQSAQPPGLGANPQPQWGYPPQGGTSQPQPGYPPLGGNPHQQPGYSQQAGGYPPQGGYGPQPGYQQAAGPGQWPGMPGAGGQPPYQSLQPKSRKGLFVGLGVAVLGIIVAIVAIFWVSNNSSSTAAPSTSQSASAEASRDEDRRSREASTPEATPSQSPSDQTSEGGVSNIKIEDMPAEVNGYKADSVFGTITYRAPGDKSIVVVEVGIEMDLDILKNIYDSPVEISNGKGVCGKLETMYTCYVKHDTYTMLGITPVDAPDEDVRAVAEAVGNR